MIISSQWQKDPKFVLRVIRNASVQVSCDERIVGHNIHNYNGIISFVIIVESLVVMVAGR